MMEKKDLAKKMTADIDEMEKMLNDYLQYAKSQSEESSSKIDINYMIQDKTNNELNCYMADVKNQNRSESKDANLVLSFL